MRRDPLLQLPPPLTRRWRHAGAATCWESTAARRRRSPPCSICRSTRSIWPRGPEQRGRRRRGGAARGAARVAADGRSSEPASTSASSARPCSRSPAPTPTRSRSTCSRARTDAWIVVNDVVGAWADGHAAQPGRRPRSPAPARTCSASGPTAAPGAPAAGAICSATRAAATGSASQSINAALRDRDGSGPETALSDAAVEFFDVRERRGARGARVLQAADQVARSPPSRPRRRGSPTRAIRSRARCITRGARELARQILTVVADARASALGAARRSRSA